METCGHSARVQLWDRLRGACAFFQLHLPNDPITERAPILAPGFHSFWTWAMQTIFGFWKYTLKQRYVSKYNHDGIQYNVNLASRKYNRQFLRITFGVVHARKLLGQGHTSFSRARFFRGAQLGLELQRLLVCKAINWIHKWHAPCIMLGSAMSTASWLW